MISSQLYLFIILIYQTIVWPFELDIRVVSLFRDFAVVEINQQLHALALNQSNPQGVMLISADTQRRARYQWSIPRI